LVANNHHPRLTHLPTASQRAVKLGILHERKFGKVARAQERMTPAEDPMIAERKAEDLDTHIPE
jgi:hypothetical protein